MRFLNNIRLKVSDFSRLFCLSDIESKFIAYSKQSSLSEVFSSSGELLIEAQRYHPYLFRAMYISRYFSKKYKLNVKTVNPVYKAKSIYFFKKFYGYLAINKLYQSFDAKPGLDYYSLNSDELNVCREKADLAMASINSKADILNIKIGNIVIGDLIYDSYLKRYKLATIDSFDNRLYEIVFYAYVIYKSCDMYIRKNNVKKVLMSHAVYIEHGILVRLCVENNIDTYIIVVRGKKVFKKLTKEDYLQTYDHDKYPEKFNHLPLKMEKILEARSVLKMRLSGDIDPGISYMKSSAYVEAIDNKKTIFNGEKHRIVIFLHCFFDSPHIYKRMLFPDFYEWLDFTLKVGVSSNVAVYVKPHPNGLYGNERIIDSFKKKYPQVRFIGKDVSNNQLVLEGFDAAVTVYGTLGHELPYMGVPVIAAGDNPHAGYNFCYTAKTLMEYEAMLRNPELLSREFNKSQIEQFFFMHYLHESDGAISPRDDWRVFSIRTPREDFNSNILSELIKSARGGLFNDIENYFDSAMDQLDKYSS